MGFGHRVYKNYATLVNLCQGGWLKSLRKFNDEKRVLPKVGAFYISEVMF